MSSGNAALSFLALTALLIAGCSSYVQRTAEACPPLPPPPPCAAQPVTTPPVFQAPWFAEVVQGLHQANLEEFPAPAGARVGSSFQSVTDAPGEQLITLINHRIGIGDADVALVKGNDTVALPFSQPVWWDGHPTRASNAIIYASERPGGAGGTDLWFVIDSLGQYTEPMLLDGTNTPCDEISPFFDASQNMLYWSTAGGPTLGGYDIVRAPLVRSGLALRVGAVTNLGAPVNSAMDDIFPVMKSSLHFASNRREGTDFDVYRLVQTPTSLQTPPRQPQVPPQPSPKQPTDSATISGSAINLETKQPLANAEITARNNVSNVVINSTLTDTDGEWSLRVPVNTPVEVLAQHSDLFFDKQIITVPAAAKNTTVQIPTPLALPPTYNLRVNFPTAIFDAPYQNTLDSNGTETNQTWQGALDELAENVRLSGTRLKRLVLIGHTDDVGTDASNLKLGRQRVSFIMENLVERGVPQSILDGRTAGESLLPVRRQGETIDQWRKRSRRVELVKVLER